MNKIAIIAAMEEEVSAIKNIMTNISENKIYNLTIYEGTINNKDCILTECGVGKVHAARTTQILIDNYDIKYVINVGSAGGINSNLNILDIVIGKDLVQYDFDLTAVGHEKGYISGIGTRIKASKELIQKCEKVINNLQDKNHKVIIGTIATGDLFCTDPNVAKNVRDTFNAECVEMEGAAIAQVCFLDNIPFLVIRSISDSPNGNNGIDFEKYLEFASLRCAEILKELL